MDYYFKNHSLITLDTTKKELLIRYRRTLITLSLSDAGIKRVQTWLPAIAKARRQPMDIYHATGYEGRHQEYSVLQDRSSTGLYAESMVSNEVWKVHLVRKKEGDREDSAFLIVEGMESDKHVARRYEIEAPIATSRSGPELYAGRRGQEVVRKSDDFLEKLQKLQDKYVRCSWDIDPDSAHWLEQKMEAEVGRSVSYGATSGGGLASSSTSTEKRYTSLSWAEAKLGEVGFKTEGNRWRTFEVVMPSGYHSEKQPSGKMSVSFSPQERLLQDNQPVLKDTATPPVDRVPVQSEVETLPDEHPSLESKAQGSKPEPISPNRLGRVEISQRPEPDRVLEDQKPEPSSWSSSLYSLFSTHKATLVVTATLAVNVAVFYRYTRK
jgi:hypothetical protein